MRALLSKSEASFLPIESWRGFLGAFAFERHLAYSTVARIVTQSSVLARLSKYSALWNLLNDGMLPCNSQGLPRYMLVTGCYSLPYPFLSFTSALCLVQCRFGRVLSSVGIRGWPVFILKAAG